MHITMICTGNSVPLLTKLCDSINPEHTELKVLIIIVLQQQKHTFKSTHTNVQITTIEVAERLSLSKARNVALRNLFGQDEATDFVLFPDDDTTFDHHFFTAFQREISVNKFYLGRVCSEEDGSDYKRYPAVNRVSGKEKLLPYVASVALILPYKKVKQVGFFDELLGAGAEYGSSEDLDYYLRCTALGTFTFVHSLRNFHPSRFAKYDGMGTQEIKQRFKSYTDGYLFVLFRHDLEKSSWLLLLKAFGGAVISTFKGNFRLVPVYLWLVKYRAKMWKHFKEMKQKNPIFFKYAA